MRMASMRTSDVAQIFSFGIILFELVTQERPVRGRNRRIRSAPVLQPNTCVFWPAAAAACLPACPKLPHLHAWKACTVCWTTHTEPLCSVPEECSKEAEELCYWHAPSLS